MKRLLVLMIFIIAIFLCACSQNPRFMSDAKRIDVQFDLTLQALQEQNPDALRMLFSPNAVDQSEDFYINLERLFAYFQGNIVSYSYDNGLVADSDMEAGLHRKMICKAYDISTTENTYLLGIELVTHDDWDTDNIGIWSLYIRDAAHTEAVFGDMGPGIHVIE